MPFLAAYISDPEHPREVSRAIFDDSARVVDYPEAIWIRDEIDHVKLASSTLTSGLLVIWA